MVHDFVLARYEMPIRQWALRDKNAARAVRGVNQIRLDFAGKGSSKLGFRGDGPNMRTMLSVCNVSMEEPFYREISRKRRRELVKRMIELLISK